MSIVVVPGQFHAVPHPAGKLASTLLSVTVAGMADPARFRRGKTYVAEHAVSRLEVDARPAAGHGRRQPRPAVPGGRRRAADAAHRRSVARGAAHAAHPAHARGRRHDAQLHLPRLRRAVQARRGRAARVRQRTGRPARAVGAVALRADGSRTAAGAGGCTGPRRPSVICGWRRRWPSGPSRATSGRRPSGWRSSGRCRPRRPTCRASRRPSAGRSLGTIDLAAIVRSALDELCRDI